MKKLTKLLLLAMLTVIMACGFTGAVVMAEEKGSVTVTVSTEQGDVGDFVDVNVSLSDNTGLQ